jgi:hypothetical protein
MQVREKRASTRFTHKTAIAYMHLGGIAPHPADVLRNIELVDVSNGGARLHVEGFFVTEKEAIVLLGMPINGIEVSIPVLGRIKWVRRMEPMLYDAGLQFLV